MNYSERGRDMILFRTDANPQIGTGHIMRCLSLADAFQERGADCVFVTAEPYMRPLIQERGYECLVLGTEYDHMDGELPAFLPLLEERRPSCLMLDSYFVTAGYMQCVRSAAPVVYIDDLNVFDYPVDIVVNYNLYAERMAYPPNKKYLLGPRYAPLRRQFQGLGARVTKEQVREVLVSTGGTDQYHVALQCAEYLREHPPASGFTYHFILGSMNLDVEQIRGLAKDVPYIMPHEQVTDMCGLMLRCDMAISAAGTTLYELCACGLPTVSYVLADNQIQGAAAFEKAGLMPCAGDVRKKHGFVKQIFSELDAITSWRYRKETAQRMQALVDGNGVIRTAEMIMGKIET